MPVPAPTPTASTLEGAFDEGMVFAIISLYRDGFFNHFKTFAGERIDCRAYLVYVLKMQPEDADYWLDEFKVK